ncbi:uncharacterized protein LOC116057040 [Xyrichtys novacula]|uniref:Uncharacterized protein LOC116057040 n=1 Tax=Xyrichtys novacula TaxID=13765 RepID=A0AAV1GX42_XYRNO|nr:uncharacterized protein LOC116057040 [Xyrichtys novacula]
MKSDRSIYRPIEFKYGQDSAHQWKNLKELDSPEPVHVSGNSDGSMHVPTQLKSGDSSAHPRVLEHNIKVPDRQTSLDSIFVLLEENIISFVKTELKKIQRVLSPDYPECAETPREDEGRGQGRSREAFLRITLHFLRMMERDELADYLQSSKKI